MPVAVTATKEATQQSEMAASVLSKPHRFILVSDLDWTMVSQQHSAPLSFYVS